MNEARSWGFMMACFAATRQTLRDFRTSTLWINDCSRVDPT